MLILRDMQKSDIENYVRWFTTQTEWTNWDAPWEDIETDEKLNRKSWTEYFYDVSGRPADRIRYKYEIEEDGVHIGWVDAYTDMDYFENKNGELAIGIDIPEVSRRNRGSGTKALGLFIDYLKNIGHNVLYLETWSGNAAMISVAKKLGFREILRVHNVRIVNGKRYDALTFKIDI